MRKILIVGAGQAGLHLAHGLLSHGYDVTLITGRSSTEIRTGPPPLVGFTLPGSVELERDRQLDFWADHSPWFRRVRMSLRPGPKEHQVDFAGRFTEHASVLDRRLKQADWLESFEDRGGKAVIHGITDTDLDYFSAMFDLIVIAVGSGDLGALFDADASRLAATRKRVVGQVFLDGVAAPDDAEEEVRVLSAPWGEVVDAPVLTAHGPARAVVLAAAAAGPLDIFASRAHPAQRVWEQMHGLLAAYAPEVAQRLRTGEILSPDCGAIHYVTPQVRHPVGVLRSGGRVLGIADVLCTSDPVCARETSDAALCAEAYLHSILGRGDQPFDEEWMRATFTRYYDAHGRASADYTRLVARWWDAAPPPHVAALLAAAQTHPTVADRWVEGFNDPDIYTELLLNPDKARAFLAETGAAPPS